MTFNKDAVMVLPAGLSKATGLAEALREIGLSAHNVVGIGDAEHGRALLVLRARRRLGRPRDADGVHDGREPSEQSGAGAHFALSLGHAPRDRCRRDVDGDGLRAHHDRAASRRGGWTRGQ